MGGLSFKFNSSQSNLHVQMSWSIEFRMGKKWMVSNHFDDINIAPIAKVPSHTFSTI